MVDLPFGMRTDRSVISPVNMNCEIKSFSSSRETTLDFVDVLLGFARLWSFLVLVGGYRIGHLYINLAGNPNDPILISSTLAST